MKKPKKPVKPTTEKIAEAAEKRNKINRTEYKAIPSGTIHNLNQVAADFAKKQGVTVDNVKIIKSWDRPRLAITRLETDAERLARVKQEYMNRYDDSKWEYEQRLQKFYKYEENQRRAATQNDNCCPPNCCCRKNRNC